MNPIAKPVSNVSEAIAVSVPENPPAKKIKIQYEDSKDSFAATAVPVFVNKSNTLNNIPSYKPVVPQIPPSNIYRNMIVDNKASVVASQIPPNHMAYPPAAAIIPQSNASEISSKSFPYSQIQQLPSYQHNINSQAHPHGGSTTNMTSHPNVNITHATTSLQGSKVPVANPYNNPKPLPTAAHPYGNNPRPQPLQSQSVHGAMSAFSNSSNMQSQPINPIKVANPYVKPIPTVTNVNNLPPPVMQHPYGNTNKLMQPPLPLSQSTGAIPQSNHPAYGTQMQSAKGWNPFTVPPNHNANNRNQVPNPQYPSQNHPNTATQAPQNPYGRNTSTFNQRK